MLRVKIYQQTELEADEPCTAISRIGRGTIRGQTIPTPTCRCGKRGADAFGN